MSSCALCSQYKDHELGDCPQFTGEQLIVWWGATRTEKVFQPEAGRTFRDATVGELIAFIAKAFNVDDLTAVELYTDRGHSLNSVSPSRRLCSDPPAADDILPGSTITALLMRNKAAASATSFDEENEDEPWRKSIEQLMADDDDEPPATTTAFLPSSTNDGDSRKVHPSVATQQQQKQQPKTRNEMEKAAREKEDSVKKTSDPLVAGLATPVSVKNRDPETGRQLAPTSRRPSSDTWKDRTVHIRFLPRKITPQAVMELISKQGIPIKIRLCINESASATKHPFKFAFVEYISRRAALRCITNLHHMSMPDTESTFVYRLVVQQAQHEILAHDATDAIFPGEPLPDGTICETMVPCAFASMSVDEATHVHNQVAPKEKDSPPARSTNPPEVSQRPKPPPPGSLNIKIPLPPPPPAYEATVPPPPSYGETAAAATAIAVASQPPPPPEFTPTVDSASSQLVPKSVVDPKEALYDAERDALVVKRTEMRQRSSANGRERFNAARDVAEASIKKALLTSRQTDIKLAVDDIAEASWVAFQYLTHCAPSAPMSRLQLIFNSYLESQCRLLALHVFAGNRADAISVANESLPNLDSCAEGALLRNKIQVSNEHIRFWIIITTLVEAIDHDVPKGCAERIAARLEASLDQITSELHINVSQLVKQLRLAAVHNALALQFAGRSDLAFAFLSGETTSLMSSLLEPFSGVPTTELN